MHRIVTPLQRMQMVRLMLRTGGAVLVQEGGSYALIAAAETISEETFAEFQARGMLVLSAERARHLKIRVYEEGLARIPVLGMDRSAIKTLVDPAQDMANPLRGPFDTCREAGGTTPSIALKLCLSAGLLPGALIRLVNEIHAFDLQAQGVPYLDAADCLAATNPGALRLERFASAQLPLAIGGDAILHGFRPSDGTAPHYALVVGQPGPEQATLARLHSECMTGDWLGSLKCDCGPQLRGAIARITAEGCGVLLYLAQEGRGIGMPNKLRAYALQDQGFDTVDANVRLGFADDLRSYRAAAQILGMLGIQTVRLMTNNPAKAEALEQEGISVAGRIQHPIGETRENCGYRETKSRRSGHLL